MVKVVRLSEEFKKKLSVPAFDARYKPHLREFFVLSLLRGRKHKDIAKDNKSSVNAVNLFALKFFDKFKTSKRELLSFALEQGIEIIVTQKELDNLKTIPKKHLETLRLVAEGYSNDELIVLDSDSFSKNSIGYSLRKASECIFGKAQSSVLAPLVYMAAQIKDERGQSVNEEEIYMPYTSVTVIDESNPSLVIS